MIDRFDVPTRRAVLASLSAMAVMVPGIKARAEAWPSMTVYKDPSCGCCLAWVEHLTAAGFKVAVVETDRIDAVKAKFGIPEDLASCHTAELGDYLIEGHVPAGAIARLLAEKPPAKGLAVAGMPIGAPGMAGEPPESYEVVLFGPQGRRTFARYRGTREI
jgi:hypothetical protein